jgi:hypothetical protein
LNRAKYGLLKICLRIDRNKGETQSEAEGSLKILGYREVPYLQGGQVSLEIIGA